MHVGGGGVGVAVSAAVAIISTAVAGNNLVPVVAL